MLFSVCGACGKPNSIMKWIIKISLCWCLALSMGKAEAKGTKSQDDEKCFKQLKLLFDRQLKLNADFGNETRFLHYSIMAVTSGTASKTYESEVKLYMNKHRLSLESQDLQLFLDEKALVSVLPGRKMIVIRQPPKNRQKFQAERLKQVAIFQDSLFDHIKGIQCSLAADGSKKEQHVKLALTPDGLKRFGISSIAFVTDQKASKIKSFTIDYGANHRLKTMQCTFKQLEYHHSGARLKKSALATVLNPDETLLDHFKEYKLIDNRKKRQ
jgi:hypothetical protein